MESLLVFTNDCINRLQSEIVSNLERYQDNESWAADWARGTNWEFATRCKLHTSLDLKIPEDGKFFDFENAVRLHKALQSLTPIQAQDPRLWAHLTHIELWDYMRARWQVEKKNRTPDEAARYIRAHYFVAQKQSRALIHNGAARLWWAAKMTHDPSRENPYELTDVMLSSLDIAKNLLERNFGRAPILARTFLEYLLLHKDELLQSGNSSRLMVRRLSRSLNFHGGICLLDSMTPQDLVAFLDSEREKMLQYSGIEADESLEDEE